MATIDDLTELLDDATYIPKQPFIITTSLLFALTILIAFLHLYLKLRQTASLHLEDSVLLTSILCLIGSTAAIHLGLSDVYLTNVISANFSLVSLPAPPDVINIAVKALRYTAAFHCLIWSAIFAVKVSFLCFFKQFVDDLAFVNKNVRSYWWGILVLVGGGWAVTLSVPFIACPHRGGEAALQCNPSNALSYTTAAIDSLTTLLILSLPFLLLRNRPSHTTRLQKLALATLTSLSFGMILLALVRSVIHTRDIPFQMLLAFVEACLATVAFSLTTYKSLIACPRLDKPREEGRQLRWRQGTLTNRRRTESQERLHQRVTTPLPDNMLPGLSTFIEGGTIRTPSRLTKTSLRRQESVLRTREVVVEVHYEKDVEKGDWDRVGSPSWMDEKWKRRSSGSSASGI